MVLAPARRSSVTSRSWKVPAARSTRPLAWGERAKICRIPSSCRDRVNWVASAAVLRLAGVVLEYRVAVAVQRQWNAPALDQAFQQREVSSRVFADAKHGVDHGAGGIVHRQQQGEFGSSVLQPGVMAAVQLHQHPRLWHPLAAKTVLRGAPAAGDCRCPPW